MKQHLALRAHLYLKDNRDTFDDMAFSKILLANLKTN